MEAEQARLQDDLQRQADNYNVILTRRDREHQEEDNLATMLRSDVERLAAERWVFSKYTIRLEGLVRRSSVYINNFGGWSFGLSWAVIIKSRWHGLFLMPYFSDDFAS